jgi:uncharacterized membrane-anchored protein
LSFIEFTGTARLDRRRRPVRRLGPGDVAIIDHEDIDRVSARSCSNPRARVVNVARSQTGRFPNPGPLLLVRGGVRLIDAPGAAALDEVGDGEPVRPRASLFGTAPASRTAGRSNPHAWRRPWPSSGLA